MKKKRKRKQKKAHTSDLSPKTPSLKNEKEKVSYCSSPSPLVELPETAPPPAITQTPSATIHAPPPVKLSQTSHRTQQPLPATNQQPPPSSAVNSAGEHRSSSFTLTKPVPASTSLVLFL
ncbi:unnamed protein product [Lathyrus oleraceus]